MEIASNASKSFGSNTPMASAVYGANMTLPFAAAAPLNFQPVVPRGSGKSQILVSIVLRSTTYTAGASKGAKTALPFTTAASENF